MTFKEFLAKTYNYLRANERWVLEMYLDPKSHEGKPTQYAYGSDDTFSVTWSLGGTSCSYDGGSYEHEAEVEPDDPAELDMILECICPHLSFLQYKSIVREVLNKSTRSHSDYYGGGTTEGHKGFKIKDLYEALQKRDLV